jgi:ferredoxin
METYTISVEGFEPFRAQAGEKLALAIENAGIDISHRCGGNARCTTCRVKFASEEPAMGDKEKDCLVEDGVLGEFRLSCQIRVDRDIQVKVLMRASEQGWEPGVELEP